jgi:hypothetical protein
MGVHEENRLLYKRIDPEKLGLNGVNLKQNLKSFAKDSK